MVDRGDPICEMLARTVIEVIVVAVGFFLGGTLGIGTIVYAVAIGPLVQLLLPLLATRVPDRPADPQVRSEPAEVEPAPAARS